MRKLVRTFFELNFFLAPGVIIFVWYATRDNCKANNVVASVGSGFSRPFRYSVPVGPVRCQPRLFKTVQRTRRCYRSILVGSVRTESRRRARRRWTKTVAVHHSRTVARVRWHGRSFFFCESRRTNGAGPSVCVSIDAPFNLRDKIDRVNRAKNVGYNNNDYEIWCAKLYTYRAGWVQQVYKRESCVAATRAFFRARIQRM